jgi:hypothetical protein
LFGVGKLYWNLAQVKVVDEEAKQKQEVQDINSEKDSERPTDPSVTKEKPKGDEVSGKKEAKHDSKSEKDDNKKAKTEEKKESKKDDPSIKKHF